MTSSPVSCRPRSDSAFSAHRRTQLKLALVVTGGPDTEPLTELESDVGDAAFVIAADSGLALARRLGLEVHVAIGDFDSTSAGELRDAASAGTEVVRLPRAKDETDLELALGEASRRGAGEVRVLGGVGGRLDHLLANALVLTSERWRDMRVSARFGAARLWVVRTEVELHGDPGEIVSLVPVGGAAEGVVSRGLAYRLVGERLEPSSATGLSNALLGNVATVGLSQGVLLAILPGERADPDSLP